MEHRMVDDVGDIGSLSRRDDALADRHFLRMHVGADVVDGVHAGSRPAQRRRVKQVPDDDFGRPGFPRGRLLLLAPHQGARVGPSSGQRRRDGQSGLAGSPGQ